MKVHQIILAILTVFMLSSCNKDNCIEHKQSPVVFTNTPATAEKNKSIPINVSFQCYNGCGQFDAFEESVLGDTLKIKVIAKHEGCVCTENLPLREAVYSFQRAESGTYFLKFLKTDNTYLTDTIVVQ